MNQGEKLAKEVNADFTIDYNNIISCDKIDVVIISTPNYLIKEIATKALNSKKHVLSEKPLGKNAVDMAEMAFSRARMKEAACGFSSNKNTTKRHLRIYAENFNVGYYFQ